MLILDKQKAIARVMALTSGGTDADPEEQPVTPRPRTYHRVATYERRPAALVRERRAIDRRRRRMRPAGEASPV